jgi:hypothetical protein
MEAATVKLCTNALGQQAGRKCLLWKLEEAEVRFVVKSSYRGHPYTCEILVAGSARRVLWSVLKSSSSWLLVGWLVGKWQIGKVGWKVNTTMYYKCTTMYYKCSLQLFGFDLKCHTFKFRFSCTWVDFSEGENKIFISSYSSSMDPLWIPHRLRLWDG